MVAANPLSAVAAAPVPPPDRAATGPTRTRGRKPSTLMGIRAPIPTGWRVALGIAGVVLIFVVWAWAASLGDSSSVLVPTPLATWKALAHMWSTGQLRTDLWASSQRVAIGYSISVAVGVVLGVGIGTFASFESFLEPQIAFLRYVPATALTPLFLLWLGLDESPKIWLIVVGTVFYNILMIADVARNVPREMLDASYTLGANRRTVVRRVVLRHALPGIIDVARINLAAAWLMLVVAEILAAQKGLAFRINESVRFRAVDSMFALLIVFGVIGLISDLFLRWFRDRAAPWAKS